tara:strand:+ start:145 stop:357 length:213 start_codon:yes stop_codon:yes gene_type:complete
MSEEMDGCSNTHLIMYDEISKYRDDGDWNTIMYDMMQEGMSKYEAMAAMAVMDCPNSIMTRLLEMKNAKS